MGRGAVDAIARPLLDDFAEIHDADFVAHELHHPQVMRDEQHGRAVPVLQVAHQVEHLRVVQFMCDEIGVMYLGEIVEQGPRDRIYGAPAHPYTQALLASAPGKAGGQRARLKGEIPSAHAVPSGCAFRTRCPHAFERCTVEKPAMREVGSGQKAACHLLEQAVAA